VGSVHSYETAAGRRYRVLYRKPDHKQAQKRGFARKRDAELFLASVEVSKARGEFIDASAGRVTIGTLATAWLATRTNLKPSSLRPLEIAWRLHVAPRWEARSVVDVRHSDVQAWVTALAAEKSATTTLRSYGVLAAVLDVAVKDRRIPSNPARGVALPRKTGKARVYLTHQQVQLLALAAGKHETLVQVLAYTGLRWGEVTGLRVGSVDLRRRRLNVTENAVNVGGRIVVGTPKSHQARSVPLPTFLDEALRGLTAGRAPTEVLFGDGAEYVRTPDGRRGWWVAAIRKARAVDEHFPTITIHDLRHTAASLAISAGANVKAVQRMLGHASAAMTLDTYADLFDDDLDAVGTALDQARTASDVAVTLPLPTRGTD
jgi:integrase